MRACLYLALVCCAALAPVEVAAQSDAAKAMAGPWEISNADHDKICAVTLRGDTTAGGLKLDFDRAACGTDFPPLKEAVAWDLIGDNLVRIVGAKGKVLYEFTEVESGTYESLRPGQPLTFLQSAAAAGPPPRTAEQMTGDWGVARGANPPACTLTLTMNPAPVGKDELALKVAPGCDPVIVRFGPVSWHMERGELILRSARGTIWRFEESDGTWQRIPEGPDPIMLVRP
jgi:Protease inhibitor Inh